MKRMLCMILSLVMALSLAVPAFAAVTNGAQGSTTEVTYTPGASDEDIDLDGDGIVDDGTAGETIEETWTVVVPASMTPDTTKQVKAYGYWDASKTLTVNAANTVTLTAEGYDGSYNLAVTMKNAVADSSSTVVPTIEIAADANGVLTIPGLNADNCYGIADIYVGNFTVVAPLLGTWTGTFDYVVSLDTVTPQVQTFSIMRSTNAGNNAYSWADFAAKVNDGTAVDANVTVGEAVDGQIEVSVGTSTYWYSGEFNANGNTDNCSFSGYVFDYVDGATIKNLELNGTSLAGLIKNAKGTVTISNCTFTNCTFSGYYEHSDINKCLVTNIADGASVVLQNVVISGSGIDGLDGTYNTTITG